MVAARVLALRGAVPAALLPGALLPGTLLPGALPGAPRGEPTRPSSLADQARGRLVELASGPASARTSAAVQLLLASQAEGDPVAWIGSGGAAPYPPDLAAAGLDLRALLLVRVPDEASVPKAAELVLRTGAFGAVAVDLDGARLPRGEAWLGRLHALAREHDCRCALLSPPAASSLGPLVALRLLAERRRARPARFTVTASVLKDKTGGGGALCGPSTWVGPEGLP